MYTASVLNDSEWNIKTKMQFHNEYNKSNRNYGPTLELCLKTVPLSAKTYHVEN